MTTNGLYELRCRECGKTWRNVPRSFCEDCFSPLEVAYDYDALKTIARRDNLAARDFNMWRYSELLPLPEDFTARRSEEHTSELQSLRHLVCRLLLDKKTNRFDVI